MLARQKQLEKELAELQRQMSQQAGASLIDSAQEVAGVKAIIAEVTNTEAKALREMVDDLKNRLGSGIVCLGLRQGDKVSLIVGVTNDLTKQVKAGELVNFIANQVGR